jgi:hypothetical protein
LTVALQTGTVGTQTIIPPNKFLNLRTFGGVVGATSVIDINSNNLKNLQIQYSKVYPKTQYTSGISATSGYQQLMQRYEDTFENSQSMWSVGQQEPFSDTTNAINVILPYSAALVVNTALPLRVPVFGFSTTDYLSRGALFCTSVSKPADNRTTDCQITIEYNVDPVGGGDARTGLDLVGNPQVLVLSSFKKTCHITIVSGSVASVESIVG